MEHRFLLAPKWIISHVLVLGLIVVMINLGFWQLRRLDEKQDLNAIIEARAEEPVAPVTEIAAGTDLETAVEVEYRRASAEGTFDADAQVAVLSRSLNGHPGSWILTPLNLADGRAVVVNRGWFPLDGEPPVPAAGPVSLTGLVRNTEVAQGLQNADPATGILTEMARVDLDRLQDQSDRTLLPVYLQLATQQPPGDPALPVLLGPPELDDGPHFGYAVQWFIFSTIGILGYPLVLRRLARGSGKDRRDGVPEWD